MKEFNLDEYLKNPKMKVVTKDRRSVRIICTDKEGDFPIVALIKCQDGKELVFSFTKEGEYSPGASDNKDLFFATKKHKATKKHEGWGVISGFSLYGSIFSSKKEAEEFIERAGTKCCTAIAKIEWEE